MTEMKLAALRQLWRLTKVLFKLGKGALAHKDVKNAGRSGDMYENTGNTDEMTDIFSGFLP